MLSSKYYSFNSRLPNLFARKMQLFSLLFYYPITNSNQ
nr:MAG TPA: Protein RDM1, Protein DEFECTIVE IN-hinge, Coiled-coil, SNF2, RNA-directed DNA.5A [Caudoviricetes sp.]